MTKIGNRIDDSILEKIYKSGLKLLDPLNPQETYRIIANEAVKLVGGDESRIVLAEKEELNVVYVSSSQATDIVKVRKKGFTYKAYTQNKAFFVHTKKYPRVHPQAIRRGVKSAVFIPMSYRNKTLGVLIVQSFKEEYFTDRELNVLKLFGSMASLALRKTQLYEETRSALETRDLFISLASHELRTPLTSISGYVQLLQTRLKSDMSPESRWVNQLAWECKRLTNLVKELLEVNQMNAGQLHYFFKECDLKEVIDRVISNFRVSNMGRNIVFEDKANIKQASVIGDFDKLIQLMNNLIGNAVKFSSQDTPIKIDLKSKTRNFIIQIKDQGLGIDKSDLPKIFQEFYKGRDNLKEGMGLGLFLVKNIVNRHHGSIKVLTKPDRGTVVKVFLPKARL